MSSFQIESTCAHKPTAFFLVGLGGRKILKFEHSEIDSEGNFESEIELTDIDLIPVLDFLELLNSR
jgi:hypothetical protein